jgi:hypothetical protein
VIDDGNTAAGLSDAKGMDTRQEAEDKAMKECLRKGGIGCKTYLTYHNQCAAVIAGDNYAIAQGAASIARASDLGLQECHKDGTPNCTVYYTACSLPQRIQ